MILGMTISTFTLLHVLISLVGIGSGFIVLYGLLTGKRLDGWTAVFLVTTVLTSLTGFLFPFEHLLPSHVVGVISLVVLAVAILARYVMHLAVHDAQLRALQRPAGHRLAAVAVVLAGEFNRPLVPRAGGDGGGFGKAIAGEDVAVERLFHAFDELGRRGRPADIEDRKSTRLNFSH